MKKSFTIIATPKTFKGIHKIRQYNAITSWKHLRPEPPIILCGDEYGIKTAVKDLGCEHLPDVLCDRDGMPLISDLFKRTQEFIHTDLTVYVNCDILLPPNFPEALFLVADQFPDFLMVGSRWDTNVSEPVVFDDTWHRRLLAQGGRVHQPGGTDYVAFPREHWENINIAPFAIGRCRWDNYIIGSEVDRGIPVVDATKMVTVFHQDISVRERRKESKQDKVYVELYRVLRIKRMGNLTDTQWMLSKDGKLEKRWP